MQKFVTCVYTLFLAACIGACGGGTTTTAATSVYDLPATLAPANPHMGGSVQGTPLGLSNTVSTLAGTAGSAALVDDNGPAARFNHPTGITTDGTTLYVADYLNNVIRQIDLSSGAVTTLKDLTGVTISFNLPTSLTTTITAAGTQLYVVDSGSNTIRMIDIATKNVTTIGSTTGQAGSVDSTVPADVRFIQPTGITTDGVNLYVTDSGNHTVRRIVIATAAVSTLAGTAGALGTADGPPKTARFNLPGRITTDGVKLYLTDFNNRTIRTIDILTGSVTTLAGIPGALGTDEGTTDGVGTAARFNQPNGITTDGTNLYVTDSYKNTIRKVVIASGEVTTISGIPGSAGSVDSPGTPSFNTPVGITTDGVSLFVADRQNNTIRKIQ